MNRSRWCSLLTALTILWADVARADISESRRAQLIIKALSYDRAIKTRAKATVNLAVLTNGSGCEDEVAALNDAARNARVDGLPLKVATQVWSEDIAAVEAALTAANVTAAFVCPGTRGRISAIVATARKLDILTFAGSEADVRAGISIGVVARGSRPVLMVNMSAVKEEGVDLDSALMRFAGTLR